MTGKITEHNGRLYITTTDTMFNEPVRYTQFWPTGLRSADYPKWIGKDVSYLGDLLYGLQGWNSTKIRLSSDKCEFIEEQAVPIPKTRGLDTRWHNGRWEKLTKKGWVIA